MSPADIEAQRQQLFRALAVLHVARLSLTTSSEGFDADECATALQVVHKLVDDVAAALEPFAGGGQGNAANVVSAALGEAASVEQGLRRDAGLLSVEHPRLQTVHARLLQAAQCVKQLAELLARTISN